MKAIIDILIVYDTPYKKNIGEILNLSYIKKENIFLMNYIIKFKKNANPFVVNNPCKEEENENDKNKKNENKDDSINNKNQKTKENQNTENFSLEEVYKYIQGDNDSKKTKKKNKKRQKKKKNEKNVNIEINSNNNENKENNDYHQIDPIVEEFIQCLIEFNRNNQKSKKVKPNISQEWIKSIS